MLSFSVFVKFHPRRPTLFSFVGEVPIRSGPPSPVFAAAHIPLSRHTLACDEKQLLLSPSKTRLYKSPSHRDACKSFRIHSYENSRVSPAISHSFFVRQSPHAITSPLPLLSFHSLTNCPRFATHFEPLSFQSITTVKFSKSFVLITTRNAGGWGYPLLSNFPTFKRCDQKPRGRSEATAKARSRAMPARLGLGKHSGRIA
jgi:hypothetical protein